MNIYYELHYNNYCIFLAAWLQDDLDYPSLSFEDYVKMVNDLGLVTYGEYAQEFLK